VSKSGWLYKKGKSWRVENWPEPNDLNGKLNAPFILHEARHVVSNSPLICPFDRFFQFDMLENALDGILT